MNPSLYLLSVWCPLKKGDSGYDCISETWCTPDITETLFIPFLYADFEPACGLYHACEMALITQSLRLKFSSARMTSTHGILNMNFFLKEILSRPIWIFLHSELAISLVCTIITRIAGHLWRLTAMAAEWKELAAAYTGWRGHLKYWGRV